ncbi:type II toxin-antitoxin system RelE/ParE family toxin [Rhizobium sp. AAP43]|uniref:type II toxin-antitoxin system RelE/ParE family toxin n=1 Tax=Rhizobium sp. AAP43 TaxID=1523420 RepID=UPI0009E7CE96|nr:type II toxin-antitoxin system RelE/ParE family toxin [Rhizobium sp. AAP43]
MKLIQWLGSGGAEVRAFPDDARIDAGWQLELVQRSEDPDDWKPMPTIGPGVREIRTRHCGDWTSWSVNHLPEFPNENPATKAGSVPGLTGSLRHPP